MFGGHDYGDYDSWKREGIMEGTIVEAEWRSLNMAEIRIVAFIARVLEIDDEELAKEMFVRLIRNRPLSDIKFIAAIAEQAENVSMKSEFMHLQILNESLAAEASTEARKAEFKRLIILSTENLNEAESAELNSRQSLIKIMRKDEPHKPTKEKGDPTVSGARG